MFPLGKLMILWYALLLQNSSDITRLISMKQHNNSAFQIPNEKYIHVIKADYCKHHKCEDMWQYKCERGVLDTTLCDKICHWLAAGRLFSPGTPVSSTNKTDRHDVTNILLKVALNTITITLTL